jgi:hypothetical protein
VIELLVKRDLMDPNTMIADQEERVSLLAYGTRYELDDSYLQMLVEKDAKAVFERTEFRSAPTTFALAVKREWPEGLLLKMSSNGFIVRQSIEGTPVLAILYRRKQFVILENLIVAGMPTDFQIDGRTFLGKMLFDGGPEAEKFVCHIAFHDGQPFHWHTMFDLYAKGAKGQTALHDLCEGKFSEAIFWKLLNLGVDPYAKNEDGKSAIEILVERRTSQTGKPPNHAERRDLERGVKRQYRPRRKT